jgi:hypothetical protein
MNGFYFKISDGVVDLKNLFVEADILHFIEKFYERFNSWVDSFSVPTATGEYLDQWSEMYGVCREHYGYNWKVKPNSYCYWDNDQRSHTFGWNENDEHLRKRIKAGF